MEQSPNAFETLAPRRRSSLPFWVAVISIVILIAVGWRWRNNVGGGMPFLSSSDTYQAVFLTNNQVYFGKLVEQRGDYAILTDIFYLQVAQPLQPSQPNVNPNVNLVKLGNELHGPADKMEINRDHILFVEDLRSDSQVAQGIAKYKAEIKPK